MRILYKVVLNIIVSVILLSSCSLIKESINVTDIHFTTHLEKNMYYWTFGNDDDLLIKRGIENNDRVCFYDDEVEIKIHFNKAIEEEKINEIVTLPTNTNYKVSTSDTTTLTLMIKDWAIGDVGKVEILDDLNTIFLLEKVPQTKVLSNTIIEPLKRETMHYSGYMDIDVELNSGSTMLIEFSSEVNKESVSETLANQFNGKDYTVDYSFVDDRHLSLVFNNKDTNHSFVNFTLSKAIDKNGCNILDNQGYSFSLKNRGSVLSYNTNLFNEIVKFDTKAASDVAINNDASLIIIEDFATRHINNGDIPNPSFKGSFLNIYNTATKEIVHINGMKKIGLTQPEGIFVEKNFFFYSDTIYNFEGNVLSEIDIDARAVNSSTKNDELVMIHLGINNELLISLLDVQSKSVKTLKINSYDSSYGEERFYSKNFYFNYLPSSKVIYEYYNLETFNTEVMVYDINSKTNDKLIEGELLNSKSLSPCANYIVINDSRIYKIIDVNTADVIFTFPNNLGKSSLVWQDESHLFFNENNIIYKLSLKDKSIINTNIKGRPVSCMNDILYVIR